jgi:hypothetical protein
MTVYAYCNHKDQKTQTGRNLMSSLVAQLISESDEIHDEVLTIYKQYCHRGTKPDQATISQLLQTMLGALRRVYVVIDALDECDEAARAALIGALRQSTANVHLICTSRDISDVREMFEGSPKIEIQASQADISEFLKARIAESHNLVKYCKKDETLEGAIIHAVTMKADGM